MAKTARPSLPKVEFNHAMIYAQDVARALAFYRDLLGFKLIEDYQTPGGPVYARLRSPAGSMTIALHKAGAADAIASPGIRLYFEVKELDAMCERLQSAGVAFTQMPKPMPWGWTHAYLNDPDGHEVSLYWAGVKRMRKSKMAPAVQRAAKM